MDTIIDTISISSICIQIDSIYADIESTAVKLMAMIDKHAYESVDLVVMPECCLTGYAFKDRQAVIGLAEVKGKGKQFEVCRNVARKMKAYAAMGYIEREDESEGKKGIKRY